MRAVTGRWAWGLSGLITALLLLAGAVRIITHSVSGSSFAVSYAGPPSSLSRTFTVPQRVNSVTVDSYGAPVRITGGNVPRVTVTETVSSIPSGLSFPQARPANAIRTATHTVTGGRLRLADRVCGSGTCAVAYAVTVPRGTASTVVSGGGPVSVTGTSGQTQVFSDGGAVNASQLGGALTATTGGGPLLVDGLSGPLTADSASPSFGGGGFVDASGLTSPTASVTTGGGPTVLGFGSVPRTVTVTTGGGSARIGVPGGPYALAANAGGGLESVEVATSPSAGHTLTVTTGGGPLLIAPSVPGVPRPVNGIFLPGPGSGGFAVVKGGVPVAPPAPAKPAAPAIGSKP